MALALNFHLQLTEQPKKDRDTTIAQNINKLVLIFI
jgi:hypothetical protein